MYNIDNVSSTSFDWKEDPGEVAKSVVESINELLTNRGLPPILMYDDPATEGQDTYGFIFSTDELSESELKEASKDINGWEEDDPEMDEFDEGDED